MSFTYTARLRIKPGTEATFLAAVSDMIAVAKSDPGTLDYKVFTLDDPLDFVFYESYIDQAADEAHRSDPVSGEIIQRMLTCIDESGFALEHWTPVAALPTVKA